MLAYALAYLALSLGAVAALSGMIVKIGGLMSTCPAGGPAARTAALTIATGFFAIGAGLVLMIGGALVVFAEEPALGLALGLGFAALCLGLGFTQAAATLRSVTAPDRPAE